MKTDDLIDLLAKDAAPPSGGGVPGRLAMACGLAAMGALALLLVWLGLRPDLHMAMRTGAFWMKAGYTLWVAGAGFVMTAAAARPGGAPGRLARMALVGEVVVIAGLALIDLDGPPLYLDVRLLMNPQRRLARPVRDFTDFLRETFAAAG